MGEATYYLKARFNTPQQTKKVEVMFRSLLNDLVKLNDEWQNLRNKNEDVNESLKVLKKFPSWILLDDFEVKLEDKNMNFLSGPLPDLTEDFRLEIVDDTELRLSDTVWHFTHWDGIVAWLEKQPGCQSVNYISDEYLDPWNSL